MKKLGPICLLANMAKMAGRINTLVNLALHFNSQGLGEKDISKFCFLKNRKIKFFLP